MTAMELKGVAHELLSQIQDETVLRQLVILLGQIKSNRIPSDDVWHELSATQQAELLLAIAESENEGSLVSQEDARKLFDKWRGQ